MEEKCLNLINYANHHHHHQMDDDQLQLSSEGGGDSETAGAAASTTDATTNEINKIHHHINHIHRHHNRIDSTGTGIFLETPIIEENTISMNSHDYENAKPKRLSDEFLSQSSDEDQLLLHTTSSADVAVLESLKEEGGNLDLDVDEDDENDREGDIDRPEDDEEADGDDEVEDGEEDDEITTDSDVQSMDAIERRDFEHEQRLTGGRIMKLSSLTDGNNCLKLNLLSQKSESDEPSSTQASSVTASESKSANSSDYGAAGTSGVNDRMISSDSKVSGVFYYSRNCFFFKTNLPSISSAPINR